MNFYRYTSEYPGTRVLEYGTVLYRDIIIIFLPSLFPLFARVMDVHVWGCIGKLLKRATIDSIDCPKRRIYLQVTKWLNLVSVLHVELTPAVSLS